MYKVQWAGHYAGRRVLSVRSDGKLVSSASIEFVDWMRDRVPDKQLRPEQRAMVRWCSKRAESMGQLIG